MRGLKDSYDLWYKRCQTFLFPPWLKTKIQMLGVTILLSLTVFMNMVSEIIPNTSDAVSIIGIETIPEDFKFLEYEYTFHSTASLALSLVNRNIIILYIFTYLSCYMTLFEDNFLFSFLFIYQCMWRNFLTLQTDWIWANVNICRSDHTSIPDSIPQHCHRGRIYILILKYNSMDFHLITPESLYFHKLWWTQF